MPGQKALIPDHTSTQFGRYLCLPSGKAKNKDPRRGWSPGVLLLRASGVEGLGGKILAPALIDNPYCEPKFLPRRLPGVQRQQCAENQIGDNGFQQGARRLRWTGDDVDMFPLLAMRHVLKSTFQHDPRYNRSLIDVKMPSVSETVGNVRNKGPQLAMPF
jgi:hypothetical protein